ncbi:MAG TPA: methyltransferase domain-containing protein [Geobacterales bacterium]|nr:methyltransferase domain-containing protein [Geobacterales bacterium]
MKGLDGELLCIRLVSDYPNLSEKEILYSLEDSGFYYEYLGSRGPLLILRSSEFIVPYLLYRCSKIKEIIKLFHIGTVKDFENLNDFDFEGSFVVRIDSFDLEYKACVPRMEKDIGAIFFRRGKKVDLKKPDVIIRGYIKDGYLYLGKLLAIANRSQFFQRRPSKKPAFHPSSMMPENARLMINLGKAPLTGVFLDPFCGVGGILIEAAYISNLCIGIDIDPKMLKGCQKNIKYYGFYNVDLILADALKIPLRRFDCIVSDTPYGIASSLKKRDHEKLVEDFLNEIRRGRVRICIATVKPDLEARGWKVILKFPQRVRKSLIRWLYVLEHNGNSILGHIGE